MGDVVRRELERLLEADTYLGDALCLEAASYTNGLILLDVTFHPIVHRKFLPPESRCTSRVL